MDVESVRADSVSFVFSPVGSYIDTSIFYTKEEIDALLANVGAQSDWSQSDSTKLDFIKNKPTIPAAPVQSDWNESNSTSLAYIKNKPELAAVATSGSYDDLSDKPTISTIPATATQSEINAGSSTTQRTFTPQLLHDNAYIVEESYTSGSLKANKFYDFGTVSALNVPPLDTTNDLVSNALNFYALRFIAGADNLNITFQQQGVVVDDEPTINTGDYVEIMINLYVVNGSNNFYASIKVWQAQ